MVRFRIAVLFRPPYLAAACQWATGACAPKTCIPGPPFSLVYQAYQASLKTWPYCVGKPSYLYFYCEYAHLLMHLWEVYEVFTNLDIINQAEVLDLSSHSPTVPPAGSTAG